ncbi:YceI family protein [Sulfurimonas sp.]|uniref:YceI family protein n=1 Tax=Sulfurimonas sp. TaxID=2022749 RepID=UPI003D0BB743
MAKRLMFLMVLPLVLFGGNLTLKDGTIKAHTEVFGDSEIEPAVTKITANLSMDENNLESISGDISFNIIDFISSSSGRDEHMQEMFEMEKYPAISLSIVKIVKEKDNYVIYGTMHVHGISNSLQIPVTIAENNQTISMHSDFQVKVTDYGMEPPSLLFMDVRNEVDINATLNFNVTN